MNVNPDFITVSGYSGGAYMATNLATIYSSTFAGAMAVSGGPALNGFKCNRDPFGLSDCDAEWIAE